ncbi:unnamed protein product [Dimorphilus gyrociliatus]|uniref:Uncharacterized protein n=1 Tax=Dimorphilus gyrociliatus TaxID=2664684 RepID=A0A7I8VK97_9ANNE|nr:unnamed protein product [Dimorphilus gyrociliatus]
MEESSIIIHHAPSFPQFNATTQTETPSGLAVGIPRSISADGRTISQDSRSDGFYSATEELNDNDSFISAFGFFT